MTPREKVTIWMQVVVSLVSLVSGISLVFISGNEVARELGAGWVGLVIGYWLSPPLQVSAE